MDKAKPQIFIASSVEGLNVAYALQELLEHDAECTVWDQGVFVPSSYTMPDLIARLKVSDFGIFVFSTDDDITCRGEKHKTVRDNVVLELGLFIGAIGQQNCFIVTPKTGENIHVPTDLAGITMLKYDPDRKDRNLSAALGPSVNQIRKSIKNHMSIKTAVPEALIEQITNIGLNAFYSSREDYSKYRDASSIDRYISRATSSIHMVSITLSTGMAVDDICKVFQEKLKQNKKFKIYISLLDPNCENLYKTVSPLFKQSPETMQGNTKNALKTLLAFKSTLNQNSKKRFCISVHQVLPFGSAIILDGDTESGTIQIETKPYDVGMRKSFAFELKNNGGDFYETIKRSYYKLIKDGVVVE